MMNSLKNKLTSIREVFKEESLKKYCAVFAVILIIAILCELFVFNFKWISSIFDKEIILSANNIEGLNNIGGDTFEISSNSVDVEIKNINEKIKYIYFNPSSKEDTISNITISAQDEANENYLLSPARTVLSFVETSKYIRLHYAGEIKALKINIRDMSGKTIKVSDIKLNARVPLMFSWIRFIILQFILMMLFLLRPGSFVYKYKTDLKRPKQLMLVVLLIFVQSILFFNIMHWNSSALNWHYTIDHHQQYYKLVDSLKKGHFYISDDVPDNLKNMENPYDRNAKYTRNVLFKWDHAYYKGKYYCYFGAIPAVILYLPYNLITGNNLPNYMALFVFGILDIAGIMLLLWEVIKKWYRNTPFVLYLLLSTVFSAVAGIAYTAYKPDFYMVPYLSAIAFALWGLALWISAEKNETSSLSSRRLAIGSLCIALTAGCRPQFLLTALLGVVFFWDYAFKKRELFSKKSMSQTIAVCLPFVIVGALIMWYNAARFGSPFDFGANYNLTTNDMTHRGFFAGRTGLGLFTYLFQPIKVNSIFPFIHDFRADTIYQGLTLTENLMGGVLMLYPILTIGIYGVFNKNLFADKRVYKIVYLTVIMSIILIVLDTQMGGLLTRYFNDFVWLLMLASAITIFTLYDKYFGNIQAEKVLTRLSVALSATTLVFAFLSIFAHTEYAISSSNPNLYYTIQHLIAFWM